MRGGLVDVPKPSVDSSLMDEQTTVLCCFCGLFLDSTAQLDLHLKVKHQTALPKCERNRQLPTTNYLSSIVLGEPHQSLGKTNSAPFPSTSKSQHGNNYQKACSVPSTASSSNSLDNDQPSSSLDDTAGQRNFICRDCGLFFIDFSKLQQHVTTDHRAPQPETTTLEDATEPKDLSNTSQWSNTTDDHFAALVKAVDSTLATQSDSGDRFPCGRCGFRCLSIEELERHFDGHSYAKLRYLCPKCQKRFPRRIKLEDHYRIHTGEKPYKCPICPAAFCQLSNRNRHINTHQANFRPFVCHICNCGFSRRFSLISHYHVHADNHPFRCNQCGQCFTAIDELQQHVASGVCFK